MEKSKKKGVFIYVPALHQGYLDFLDKHLKDGDELYLLNMKEVYRRDNIKEFEHLQRDLRAMSTDLVFEWVKMYFKEKKFNVHVGILKTISSVNFYAEHHIQKSEAIIMPDDDVTATILDILPHVKNYKDLILEKMFLRWDKNASLLEVNVDAPTISSNDLPQNIVDELQKQIGKSVDWWRQVACVIYNDQGEILFATYNKHLPTDLSLNIVGDPRFNFKPGEHIENCTAIHSEQWVIAYAAKKGIALEGMNMFVSDFPCPVCAKSIAETGIKNLFFVRGYSKIEGQKTLEDRGILLQKVRLEK
jgi:dCMP deaminase